MPGASTQSAENAQVRSDVRSAATEEALQRWSRIVKETWTNEPLKRRLLENPAPILEQYGLKVPPGLDVRIVENTDKVAYLTLPGKQPPTGDLTMEQLDQVVGGIAMTEYLIILAIVAIAG